MNTHISIVLNAHNEKNYISATIRSLAEAVSYANYHDLNIEMIVVLDRSEPEFKRLVTSKLKEEAVFDDCKIIEADCGSLGLARNVGIEHATGEFIATADADDLVSFNYFHDLHRATQQKIGGKKTDKIVAIPQYLYAFGDNRHHIFEIFGSDQLNIESIVEFHPFTSRIFLPRAVFSDLKYVDTGPQSPFHFEDWHLNMELLLRGYKFVPAADAMVFYRLRPSSIMAHAQRAGATPYPNSTLLEPAAFTKLVEASRGALPKSETRIEGKKTFLSSAITSELLAAANKIDPQVNPIAHSRDGRYFSNANYCSKMGSVYFDVCKKIGRLEFSDIWVTPILSKGGAEKFIIDVLNSKFGSKNDNQKLLVVVFEESDRDPEWIDKLPQGAVVLPIAKLLKKQMALKSIVHEKAPKLLFAIMRQYLNQHSSTCIHLSDGVEVWKFFAGHKKLLKDANLIYYRFNDSTHSEYTRHWDTGSDYAQVSAHLDDLDLVISDNQNVVKKDINALGFDSGKQIHIYARTKIKTENLTFAKRCGKKAVLWAARLDTQKRPDLLPQIASALEARGSDVVLDIFGSAVLSPFPKNALKKRKNLSYQGPFDGLSSIDTSSYLGFIHTSLFDGLPNTLIEALELGMPIIAPHLGGIPEIIENDKTGFLLEPHSDDKRLAEEYAEAIIELSQWSEIRFANFESDAISKLTGQHSPAMHDKAVQEAFAKFH